jgi:hypothetical protein
MELGNKRTLISNATSSNCMTEHFYHPNSPGALPVFPKSPALRPYPSNLLISQNLPNAAPKIYKNEPSPINEHLSTRVAFLPASASLHPLPKRRPDWKIDIVRVPYAH